MDRVFSLSIYGPSAPGSAPGSAQAVNRREKKPGYVTYSTVSKIFIISLFVCDGFGVTSERFPFLRNGFKFLKQVESKTSQFEIVFKSLARFITQFRVQESKLKN